MIGTPLGALFGSSAFMNVATTSALAITAGSALAAYTGDAHAVAIATLSVLTGVVMVLAGVHPKIKGQLDRTGTTGEILGAENVFEATTTLGVSTRAAYAAAELWLQQTAGPHGVGRDATASAGEADAIVK